MKPSDILAEKRTELREIMNRPRYVGAFTNLRVYGSVARGTDTEESDIDFLVDRTENSISLLDIASLYTDLEEIVQIKIDLTLSSQIPDDVRRIVMREAKPV